MTHPAPAGAPAPPPPAAGKPAPPATEQRDWLTTAGTWIMAGAIAACVVILLDTALKGRILGPVFARLGATPPPPEDDGPASDR
jgi:hypothetical protein